MVSAATGASLSLVGLEEGGYEVAEGAFSWIGQITPTAFKAAKHMAWGADLDFPVPTSLMFS